MSEAAAEDIDLASLLEAIRTNEELSDMFRQAVDAAAHASSEDKLRLLGRALAIGALAQDEAAVEEAEQLLRTAVELDPVDLWAILLLRQANMRQPWVVLQESPRSDEARRVGGHGPIATSRAR